jgi:plastocyanin
MSALARRVLTGVVGALGLVGLVGATGCGSGPAATGGTASSPSSNGSPAQGAPPVSGGPDAVAIHLVAFDPPVLEVAGGATVTWTQADQGSVHTVTSGTVDTDPTGATTTHADGRFDSGQLTEGRHFRFTFSKPGTYPYFCVIHQATMRGEVRVR